jgi:DNA anti-recombination protein RmuC
MDEAKILEGIYNIQKELREIKDEIVEVKGQLKMFQIETNERLEKIEATQDQMQMTIDVFAQRTMKNANDIRKLQRKIQ